MKVRNVLTQPEQIDAATEDGYPYGLAGGGREGGGRRSWCAWCGWPRGETQGQAGG